MRIIYTATALFTLSLLSACHHFDPVDTVRQDKFINIAVINSDTYALIPNSHCTITTDTNDTVDTKLNPDAILLTANYTYLSLDCHSRGYKQNAIAITNTINHWAATDLFILPGNVVELNSKLLPYYPSHVLVLMSHKPFTAQQATEKNYSHAKADNLLYQGTVG